ncbi:MAG: hypothetical protein AAF543_13965 [Pseudomonadota bacterium]
MQRFEATVGMEPEPSGGRGPRLLEPHAGALTNMVESDPDVTLADVKLAEIHAELERRFDVAAGLSTIHRMLRRLWLRHKKVIESGQAEPTGRRHESTSLARLAVLHGS